MVADFAGQTLQLYSVLIQDGVIASQLCLDSTINSGNIKESK